MKPQITHPSKILFPKDNYTKQDIIDYYNAISQSMLPHLNCPLALQRYPNGIEDRNFYQKNKSEYFPDWIKTQKIKETNYLICNNKETLLYLTNQAAITIHSWLSTINNIQKPNKMILDLDPPDSPESNQLIIKSAEAIKLIIDKIGLKPFLMSTGSRSVHIIVPIKQERTFDRVRAFALKIAKIIEKLNPEKYTTNMNKKKRQEKIFIDVNRNSRAQLAVCPYSIRALDTAPIATPLDWKELKNFDPRKYTIKNLPKNNPWKNYFKESFSLDKPELKLNKLLKDLLPSFH